VPADAVTASGSGVDPQISPVYAELQVPRIAWMTGLSEATVRGLVADATQKPQWGFLGDPAVNVLRLNLAVADATGGRCCRERRTAADLPGRRTRRREDLRHAR
jgi:K+-transporting ATPase ATPase C chain